MELKKALTAKNRCLLASLGLLSFCNLFTFLLVANAWLGPWRGVIEKDKAMGLALQEAYGSPGRQEYAVEVPVPQATSQVIKYPVKGSKRPSRSRPSPAPVLVSESGPSAYLGHALRMFKESFLDSGTMKRQALKNKRLDRLWNVWNISFPMDKPDICRRNGDGQPVLAMVVVVSAPADHRARDTIRRTWGRAFSSLSGTFSCPLVFFVGRPASRAVQKSLQDEDVFHGDVVLADFADDYRNLTLKSILLLRWVAKRCPSSSFVLKVDDDVFVNVDNMASLLDRHRMLRNAIFGHLARSWHPIRNSSSHYFVPSGQWTSTIYPDFVAGPAYAITSDAVPRLLRQVASLPYFFLEDVYVTGMCAQKGNVVRLNHRGFKTLRTPLNPCLYRRFVTVHHLNADSLGQAWALMQTYGANATECWTKKCIRNWFGVCLKSRVVPVDFSSVEVETPT